MKKRTLVLLFAIVLSAPAAAMARVNVNVNVGIPGVLFSSPPVFLQPSGLGVQVGVDVPYDIVYANNYYYLFYQNAWYRSTGYNGPWGVIHHSYLPPIIRTRGIQYVRTHRDQEFNRYRMNKNHYRGKTFRPPHYAHKPSHKPGPPPHQAHKPNYRPPAPPVHKPGKPGGPNHPGNKPGPNHHRR